MVYARHDNVTPKKAMGWTQEGRNRKEGRLASGWDGVRRFMESKGLQNNNREQAKIKIK